MGEFKKFFNTIRRFFRIRI